MHVAAVQFDIAWENKPANHRTIEQMLDGADVPAGALIILPEMCDTGFSFNVDAIADERTVPWASDLARSRRAWVQAGDARRADDGRGRNRATLIDPDGQSIAVYEKIHPFRREMEFFGGGDHVSLADVRGAAVCPLICYDLRFPELWRLAALAGAEVFTIGASWPDARQSHWRALLIARAIENQAFVIGVNRCGRDPHLGYAGGSMIIGPRGEILAEADTAPCVLQADIDIADLRGWRTDFPALADIRAELLGAVRVSRGAEEG